MEYYLTHSWSDPLNQQTEIAYFLAPGWYTDTIYDAEGCEIIDSVFVGEPTELVITTTNVSDVTCYNAADGSIQVIAQGGIPAYNYSIDCNVYSPNNTFDGLNSGTYTLCVQDANGCIDDEVDVVIAPQPSQIVINNLVINDISCFGFDDGSASVTASGGTGFCRMSGLIIKQIIRLQGLLLDYKIFLLQMKTDVIFQNLL